jgi:hypothetical protein
VVTFQLGNYFQPTQNSEEPKKIPGTFIDLVFSSPKNIGSDGLEIVLRQAQ